MFDSGGRLLQRGLAEEMLGRAIRMKSLAVSDRYGWARHVAHQAYYSLIGREYEWELMPLAIDQKIGTVGLARITYEGAATWRA